MFSLFFSAVERFAIIFFTKCKAKRICPCITPVRVVWELQYLEAIVFAIRCSYGRFSPEDDYLEDQAFHFQKRPFDNAMNDLTQVVMNATEKTYLSLFSL